jgi:hypothetical protein
MKTGFKASIVVFLLVAFTGTFANDGAYYVSGNHLIPMFESDIVVKKEILTIKRISDNKATITVYYEFFNPKNGKQLDVGFEASSPSGDNEKGPLNGHHPYITGFTVNLNGQAIPFKVAFVSDSLYYDKGKIKSKTLAQVEKETEDTDEVGFFYVYHFRALFKEGINILQHTYTVQLSFAVTEHYELEYILTAANRWGNRQIDDFTLQIDMGSFQDIMIPTTFFSNVSEWKLVGNGKSIQEKDGYTAEFFVRKGMIVFEKKNFKPTDELSIHSSNYYNYRVSAELSWDEPFDSKRDPLPFSIDDQHFVEKPANELSKRILKNLPFARRGYVFRSAELQSYYEKQKWYKRDENYKADLAGLTREEKEWISKF